jgi:hypothetical protein
MSQDREQTVNRQELKLETQQLRDRIAQVFGEAVDSLESAQDIAFHMTDWDSDLIELVELYQHPQKLSDDEFEIAIYKFLAHVPNHLAAAKKLAGLGPIEDVFQVGVLEEDE